MLYIPLILAAGGLPIVSGLPVPSFLSGIVETIQHSRFLESRESAASYAVFGGNGETSAGWPAMSDWVSSFDTMFAANNAIMKGSCAQFGVADNTNAEIADVSTAIQSVATSSGLDPRFILAIVMQESNGCVRAPTTNYGVRNPGLMQSHNGAGTCNDASVSSPCPQSEITQMITDGVTGTTSGDGLKQCITESGASDVSQYYKAARIYNSGSIDSSGNLGAGIATHCYSSDIANRLIGWSSGPSACQAATVVGLTSSDTFVPGSSGSSGSASSSSTAPVPSTTSEAAPASTSSSSQGGIFIETATSIAPEPTSTSVSTPTSDPAPATTATIVPDPATTTAAPSSTVIITITPPAAIPTTVPSASLYGPFPGASSSCQQYYTIVAGDYCELVDEKFNISLDQLVSWNSGLDYSCSNLWLGYEYCVKA